MLVRLRSARYVPNRVGDAVGGLLCCVALLERQHGNVKGNKAAAMTTVVDARSLSHFTSAPLRGVAPAGILQWVAEVLLLFNFTMQYKGSDLRPFQGVKD
jgi:hypothetical protein